MKQAIVVKLEKCIGCGACIKDCPAPEANSMKRSEDGRQYTTVDPSRCISCGKCITSCKRGARDYIDNVSDVVARLSTEKMIVIADPVLRIMYPTRWKWILDWFRKKGCMIYDGALGSDIFVWAFCNIIESGKVSHMISPVCPAVVNYIRSCRPALISDLVPLLSPMECAAVYIRNYENVNRKILAITPCLARKMEFHENGIIDYSITFRKLMDYFEQNGIYIAADHSGSNAYQFDGTPGQFSMMLCNPGGLRANLLAQHPELHIDCISGIDRCYASLEAYEKAADRSRLPQVYDILSCDYGCYSAGCSSEEISPFDAAELIRRFEEDLKAAQAARSKGRLRSSENRRFEELERELELSDFLRMYNPGKGIRKVSDSDVDEIFRQMGKLTPEDRSYNCGRCGYRTCYEMACAIYKGLSEPDCCIIRQQQEQQSDPGASAAFREELSAGLEQITACTGRIAGISAEAGEKAAEVCALLGNLITFCSQNASIDEAGTRQLVTILETLQGVMQALQQSLAASDAVTEEVTAAVTDVTSIVSAFQSAIKE